MSRKYVAFASATITFTKQTLTGLAASVLISLSHFPVQKFIHFIFVQLPIKIWLLRLLFITAITFSLFLALPTCRSVLFCHRRCSVCIKLKKKAEGGIAIAPLLSWTHSLDTPSVAHYAAQMWKSVASHFIIAAATAQQLSFLFSLNSECRDGGYDTGKYALILTGATRHLPPEESVRAEWTLSCLCISHFPVWTLLRYSFMTALCNAFHSVYILLYAGQFQEFLFYFWNSLEKKQQFC